MRMLTGSALALIICLTSAVPARAQTAATLDVTPVDLPAHTVAPADYAATCAALNLRGFIEAQTNWRYDPATIVVLSRAVITDCHGRIFFAGATAHVHRSKYAIASPERTDDVQVIATTRLQQKVTSFVAAHETAWHELVGTGSMTDVPERGRAGGAPCGGRDAPP
jgi:hypothetical protein